MNRRAIVGITLALVVALTGLGWLNVSAPRADAGDSALPDSSALAAGQALAADGSAGVGADVATDVVSDWGAGPVVLGTAEWTVADMGFSSQYPNGFTFDLQASSSGGKIVSARVEWVHRAQEHVGVPLTVRRADGVIDPVTGTITATWAATGGTAVPPWVGVYYRWRLRDEAGNEYTTDRTEAEYTPSDPDQWDRQESDEVLVFSKNLPANMGDLVLEAMDAQRQKYLDGWGELLPYRPRVILFGDMASWLEWQVGHQDTTGLGVITVGLTSDVWGGTVQVLYGGQPRDLAYGTVLHEVEHLYQREYLAKRVVFTPGWFIEGDATFYQQDDIDTVATNYVNRMVRSNSLPNLLQGSGPTITGADALNGYYMGYLFFKYLDSQWGIAIHRQIMDLLAQDMQFTDAIAQATGMPVNTLERAWRSWLGAASDAPTLVPTWTPPAFLTPPTPMQFGKQ